MEKKSPKEQLLLDTMLTENRLLEKYRERMDDLNLFMQEKNWEKMEQLLSRLDLLSGEIRTMDDRRDRYYKELLAGRELKEGETFYTFLIGLPEQYRNALGDAYRKMKTLLIQIEGIGWAMDLYVRTLGETMNQMLNEIFPHRKGKIYSRDGQANPVNSVSLVFNRSL